MTKLLQNKHVNQAVGVVVVLCGILLLRSGTASGSRIPQAAPRSGPHQSSQAADLTTYYEPVEPAQLSQQDLALAAPTDRKKPGGPAHLSEKDLALCAAQGVCPVCEDELAFRLVQKVELYGQPVFVCSAHCKLQAKTHPDLYLFRRVQLTGRQFKNEQIED